jgi:cell division septum initiation protein DivIVA
MDILHLVDRLEEIFNAGRPIPLTHKLAVDEDRVLEIIDQMRVSIPDEVKKAQQIVNQRDRMLAQAQEEAARTVQIAKEKSDQLVEREPLVTAAQLKANEIVLAARDDAAGIRADADDYALDVLTRLESELMKSLTQVQNGIAKLRAEKSAASPEPPL